jgi:hypothetical protein
MEEVLVKQRISMGVSPDRRDLTSGSPLSDKRSRTPTIGGLLEYIGPGMARHKLLDEPEPGKVLRVPEDSGALTEPRFEIASSW